MKRQRISNFSRGQNLLELTFGVCNIVFLLGNDSFISFFLYNVLVMFQVARNGELCQILINLKLMNSYNFLILIWMILLKSSILKFKIPRKPFISERNLYLFSVHPVPPECIPKVFTNALSNILSFKIRQYWSWSFISAVGIVLTVSWPQMMSFLSCSLANSPPISHLFWFWTLWRIWTEPLNLSLINSLC